MSSKTAIRNEYDRTAHEYDEEWSYYIKATTEETLNRLSLPADASVLDVGCGTGALLSRLSNLDAGTFRAGVDLSTEMLYEAQQKIDKSIRLATADAASLPFQSNCFDVITSCNSFHFFLDPTEFLAEAHRILRPDGKLVITDWCDDFLACWLCDYYLRVTNEAHSQIFNQEEIRQFLTESGFEVLTIDSYKIDWLWGLMTVEAQVSKI